MFSTLYLEAQGRPQSLFTLKWQLRAAGIEVRSTWHDDAVAGGLLSPAEHMHAAHLQRLRNSDAVVFLHCAGDELSAEHAAVLGLAVGWGVPVIWIGASSPVVDRFTSVSHYDDVDAFLADIRRLSRSELAA